MSYVTDFCTLSLPASLKRMTHPNSFNSCDEFALGNMYLGFFTHTQFFWIFVVARWHFDIDDSGDSLDRNHLPPEDAEFIPSHEGQQGPSLQEDPL